MTSEIILKDMTFHAHHGVMEQEQAVGGEFTVNLRLTTELAKAMETDDIGDTIDYGRIFDIVGSEMAVRSKLLEHVAGRIIKTLSNEFPGITHIDIEIFKETPPLSGQVRAGVHIMT